MASLFRFIAGHAGVCKRCCLWRRPDYTINTAVELYSVRVFLFFECMHIDNGGDFADTQRERAAVLRRSIHVLGILCFRPPAPLRCLVTTERYRERETLGKCTFLTLFLFLIYVIYFALVSSLSCQSKCERDRE